MNHLFLLIVMKEIRMRRQQAVVKLTLGLFLALGGLGSAGEASKPSPKDDKEVVESKVQKNARAADVKFKQQLGLPFNSLGTLGSRIDQARRSHDPVGLANAANELAVAEKVSGKKASLTSTALVKEAAELASLRRQAAELKAVLHVSTQITNETNLITNLRQQIALTQAVSKSETDAIRRNQNPTGAPRKLLVNNYTTQYIDVYVNGSLKMTVSPGASKWCVIEHKWNPTVLKAYGNEDTDTWGPRYVWGTFKTYTWNMY
jgi:hypothetical protein